MPIKSSLFSLRTRLMLLVAGSLLPAILLLVFQGVRDYAIAKKNLIQQAESFAYQIAMFSKEVVPEPQAYLAHLATVPEVLQEGRECRAFLASTLKTTYYLDNIFVLRPNGDVSCSGGAQRPSLNLSERAYFKRVLASRAFSIGDFQISTQRLKPILVFALPILDGKGEIFRIVAVAVNLSWFGESFAHALKSRSHFAGIVATTVDNSGVVLASSPDYDNVGKTMPEWGRIKPHLDSTGRYTTSEIWLDGVVRTTAYLPVFSSGSGRLYLRVGVPLAASLAEVRHDTIENFVILALTALAAMIAAWSLSHWLVLKPLGILTRTAALLGGGVMSARTGLSQSSSEVGQLAMRFDKMAEQLQLQHETLVRESRVQEMRGATNSAMLRAESEKALLDEVCRIIKQIGGYQLAWVGYTQKHASNMLQLQAHEGAEEEVLAAFLVPDRNDSDMGPVTSAMRFGTVQVFHNLALAQSAAPWRLAASERGFATGIGLPIQTGEGIIGALGIFSDDPDAFGAEEIQLLTETTNDLAFGISALRATIELRRSQKFLNLVVNNIPSMVVVKDAVDLRFVSLNPAGENLIGFREDEIVGKTDYDLFPAMQADFFIAMDRQALDSAHQLWVMDEPITTKTGQQKILRTRKLVLPDTDGQAKYLLAISEDITEQKKTEERLTYLATHDGLTGLSNRRFLMDKLSDAWSRATPDSSTLAVLFIDLDGFKEINDTLGHFAGDEILKAVSHLLRNALREADTIARMGGDEFVVVLEDMAEPDQVTAIAAHISAHFEKPFSVAGQEIFIGASIGISLYPGDAENFEMLLRMADIAMYHAKSEGRNTYAYYSPRMRAGAKERLEMRNLLRHAIERKELVLHYQPKISVRTGELVGAEALIRWNSKEFGLVSPIRFIPLAEESGLIVPIGEWVLRSACEQAMQWKNRGMDRFVMAVNLSARQLRETDLLEKITQILNEVGLDPEFLEIEITESTFMDREANAISVLNDISDLGIRLAVDDFGTGYSSLSYLKQLPVQVLKIDQSFVRGLTSDEDDAAIVTAIVAMAKSLNLTVTAEGVETVEQLALLKDLQCDEYQGFLFSKPLPAEEFAKLLRTLR